MVFSGIPFLFYFLPVVIIIYSIIPARGKNAVLFLSSLFFYGWGERLLSVLLFLSILLGWILGIFIEKYKGKTSGKLILLIMIVYNLAMLGFFKYADFFIDNFRMAFGLDIPLLNIALPIGISFYTFQILSYGVDIYRGDVSADRNFINFGTYVTLFSQLIAGPIVRYKDISFQLKNRTHSVEKAAYGIRRFILGLGKKVLIANSLGQLAVIFRGNTESDVLFYWLYAISFTLQIYFDFSGYSDMAIGLCSIFGFSIPENFNYPYISNSVTGFWRRWHISLGSWFRDYVYIPLGGNRVSLPRHIINILIVWLLTGFWHGAAWNFVLWGLFYALLLMLEKFLIKDRLKRISWIGNIYTMFFVITGFVLFNAENLYQAASDIKGMFSFGTLPALSPESSYYLLSYLPVMIMAIIGATPIPSRIAGKIYRKSQTMANILEIVFLMAVLILSVAFIVGGSFNPFLYFRF